MNVIFINIFGCNELKLDSKYIVEEVIDNVVLVVRKVIENVDNIKLRYVVLDIGFIGEMLEFMGILSFDKVYEIFKR